MPFISTREDYRRAGNCRRLIKVRGRWRWCCCCCTQAGAGLALPPAALLAPSVWAAGPFCKRWEGLTSCCLRPPFHCSSHSEWTQADAPAPCATSSTPLHLQAVESLLLGVGVQYLVLPSVQNVLPMWTRKFGFALVTPEEHKVGTCGLVRWRQRKQQAVGGGFSSGEGLWADPYEHHRI